MANLAFDHSQSITVPSSTVNNRVITWNGTTGKNFNNTALVSIAAGVVTGVTALTVDQITIDGTSITTTASNNNINITPHGSGSVVISKVDINSGAIDGSTIGASSASTVIATQVDITGQGDLRLQDTTGGEHVAIQAAGTTTTHTLTLPATQGGSSTVLTNDGSGGLTWAAAGATDVSAHVSDSGTQYIGDNTRTAVDFNRENHAEDFKTHSSMHSTSTDNTQLIAPSTGKYIVTGGFYFANTDNDGAYSAAIYKNGTKLDGTTNTVFPDITSEHRYFNVSTIVQLDATEYVELYAGLDAVGQSIGLGGQTFSIIKVA